MQFDYGLDERPPLLKSILVGLQWAAILIPSIIIIGKVGGVLHFSDPGDLITYLQKMSFVMAATLLFQVLWGHRLPLISGPSTVLLIGVISSRGFGLSTIYTSVLLGGLILFILSVSGLFVYLQRLFTSRVVAVILLLIAFTLTPTILNLITVSENQVPALINLCFSLIFIIIIFLFHRILTGFWKSTLIIWSMISGSIIYLAIFHHSLEINNFSHVNLVSFFFSGFTTRLSFDAGVLISFIFCFLALAINDLGSIQSMYELLKPQDMPRRITRGISLTGLANVVSGFFGVVGPVNFSLSPGVIASTGCASRFTLVPAAIILFLLSFSPLIIGFIGSVPSVVIGSMLIYILCSQISAGLMVAFEANEGEGFQFETGLVIGLPILLATVIAFLPADVLDTFPTVLKPILGNGFVVGVITSLILEHLIFRKDSSL
jgi:xanthine/uracil permease